MGMNTILMLIAGIVMSTMVATQVAPSIVEGVKVKKVQTQTINNQEVIFEAIKRYITMKQVAPTTMEQLRIAGYIDAKVNNNGFGVEHIIDSEKYTINVDKALGVATITTRIEDPKAQDAFLNSFMGTSKPTRVGTTNNFQTKYVLPNEVMHGNALLMTGIPIQATPPDSNINKYWYDTSSGKATLKMYDGTSWIEVNLGGSGDSIPIQNTPPDPTKYSYWYDSSVSEKLTLRTYVGGVWKKVKEESIGSTPSGSIIAFAGTTIPDGYLLCNGQEISRLDYEDLFEAIGTTYGSTSGTTFKVPDLRGKFIRGNGSTTINHGSYGNTTHTSAAIGITQGDTIRNIVGNLGGARDDNSTLPISGPFAAIDPAGNFGGGVGTLKDINFNASRVVPTANENRPINMSMNYIIKY